MAWHGPRYKPLSETIITIYQCIYVSLSLNELMVFFVRHLNSMMPFFVGFFQQHKLPKPAPKLKHG